MKNYTQLTQNERSQIDALLKAKHLRSEIAKILGRSPSTISREIARNKGKRGYRQKQAEEKARFRKQGKSNPRITQSVWERVKTLLREKWSPEQISGWLKENENTQISHESIYQYVLRDKETEGKLYQNLRCQRRRKKRYGSKSRQGQIPKRVSIDVRPAIVDEKTRIGDWEVDTIIGKNHKQAIVTLVERKTKFALLAKVTRKTSKLVGEAVIRLLRGMVSVFTITSDNGREFSSHQEVAKELGIDFYFAHPYASWERGLNENTNGLIRQYFPKGTDFRTLCDEDIMHAMNALNNRPRKTLGYKTPNQLMFGINPPVALAT
jgi:IS30 family transposase